MSALAGAESGLARPYHCMIVPTWLGLGLGLGSGSGLRLGLGLGLAGLGLGLP